MEEGTKIPVAEYLRMSTEHQQYSTENQAHSIRQYAERHCFEIVHTYSDPAKSGLWLRNRRGLSELLQDVTSGSATYRAILVYDVSRWGRFQDADESAHYEFVCKLAGIPVHYCAEPFENDGSLPSSILKAIKRAMAGEYSRELGCKVFAGQKRLAELGFKQGGPPGLGFRRLLLSGERTPKQILAHGERKSITTDRVVLTSGPTREVELIKQMFKMYAVEGMSLRGIARELNVRGIPGTRGGAWTHSVVRSTLSHPKYVGLNVFNQRTMRLGTRPVRLPKSQWVISPGAHEGLIDQATFTAAQHRLANLTCRKTDEEILDGLRTLLGKKGRLTTTIISKADGVAHPRTLQDRFGSISRAYELIGYKPRRHSAFRISTDEILHTLKLLLATNGKLTYRIIDASGQVTAQTTIRRFGSLSQAYELVGYTVATHSAPKRRRNSVLFCIDQLQVQGPVLHESSVMQHSDQQIVAESQKGAAANARGHLTYLPYEPRTCGWMQRIQD